MDRAALEDFVQRYERAWRTAGTDALRALFTEDASYSMGPYEQPFVGLDAIGVMWESERAGPDETFTMTHEIVACDQDTGVVRVEVHYAVAPREFRDLWIVRLGHDGRCTHFEEWPFAPEAD